MYELDFLDPRHQPALVIAFRTVTLLVGSAIIRLDLVGSSFQVRQALVPAHEYTGPFARNNLVKRVEQRAWIKSTSMLPNESCIL